MLLFNSFTIKKDWIIKNFNTSNVTIQRQKIETGIKQGIVFQYI